MKVYTSYFYKVRFFKPNMIPISTAKWDPKWFHAFKGQKTLFIDKNGVLNGIRAEAFAPIDEVGSYCGGPSCSSRNPEECKFLKLYEEQLNHLDFNVVMKYFESVVDEVQTIIHFEGEPIIVLIVHEATENPCSERRVIQQWFTSHGIECRELEI